MANKTVLAIKRYTWKAEFSMFQTGIAGITMLAVKSPMKYVYSVSVSGYFHALNIVGSVANKSAIAAKSIANIGESANSHVPSAMMERAPQA